MRLADLDRDEYRDIPLIRMEDNRAGKLPVFMRRHCPRGEGWLHRHEMIQINYVRRGTLSHEINGARHTLVQGDIFVMPPYIPHRLSEMHGADAEVVELEFLPTFIFQGISLHEDIEEYASFLDFSYIEPFLVYEHHVRPRLNLAGEARESVETLLDALFDEYTARPDGYVLALRADLLRLLVRLGRCFRRRAQMDGVSQVFDRHREGIRKAVLYLQAHYAETILVEEVARIAMLSPSYFCYLFKAITGQTTVEYLTDLRVASAMTLLKETDRLVTDIGASVGFNSVAHFNRTFKAKAGLSPTQYRAASRRA